MGKDRLLGVRLEGFLFLPGAPLHTLHLLVIMQLSFTLPLYHTILLWRQLIMDRNLYKLSAKIILLSSHGQQQDRQTKNTLKIVLYAKKHPWISKISIYEFSLLLKPKACETVMHSFNFCFHFLTKTGHKNSVPIFSFYKNILDCLNDRLL